MMAVGGTYVFCPSHISANTTSFSKATDYFSHMLCRGERRKYARKKSCLNQGLNSQPPGHESDMLTTEPPAWGTVIV